MAKNLKIGDLVKVKIGCKSTEDLYFNSNMNIFEDNEYIISDIIDVNKYELSATISTDKSKIEGVNDWEFSGDWLKKVKPTNTTKVKTTIPNTKRQVAMIKSTTGMTLILDGITYNLQNDHVNYSKIVDKLVNKDYNDLETLINVSKAVESFGEGKLSVKGGVVVYNSKQLHGCITDSILGLIKDGFSVEPIVNFLDNLSKNPSFRAQNELYGFLEYGKLPITEDGCFLTYKKIRNNWTDIHSGKFDNSIGAVCEMPRHEVDDNSSNTCSSGLHVCSYEYTKSFGGSDSRLVLCKVNPADVVSIPVDYSNTKMRCCKYKVVAEVKDKSDVLKGKSLYTG